MIRIEHVTKKFKTKEGEVCALSDVSFELPNTGFVALCGENGCGKTTLLNLISTLMSDYSGRILIDNLDVSRNDEYVKGNLVSYVLQDDYFVRSLNVADSLFLEDADYDRIQTELCAFKISDKSRNKPHELSGGQRQRVSFIRGTLKESAILLVDEPTSSMDEEMEKFVFEKLKVLSKTKLVVLVSHNLSMIHEYSDLIVKLNNGKIESVIRNSSASDITYKENEIFFPGELNFRAIDKNIASKMIETFGQIIIKRGGSRSDSFDGDYTPYIHKDVKTKKKTNPHQRKIMFRSMIAETVRTLASLAIVLGVLLVFFEAMLDLKTFDSNGFVYNSIKNNGETLVSTSQQTYESEDAKFTISDVLDLEKKYGSRIDLVTRWETPLQLECEDDDFYLSVVCGVSRSFLSNKDILKGVAPTGDKFALTDYLADSLIRKNNSYSSYDDIISKGVFIGEYRLDICGIVDTDYEKYKSLDEDEWSKKDSDNFSIMQMKLYTLIFCDAKTEIPSKLGARYIISGDCLADVIPSGGNDNLCTINTALAERLCYDGTQEMECKTDFGYVNIGAIIDDGLENPTLYMGEDQYNSIINSTNTTFEYMNTEIVDKELISFLSSKSVRVDSYTGTYAYKIVESIELLGKLFVVLSALIFAALSVLLYFMLKKVSKANTRMFVFQKLSGYRKKYFLLLELAVVSIGVLAVLLVNLGAYYLNYFLLNAALSNAFEISICFMMNSMVTFGLVAVGVCALSFLFELLHYHRRDRKEIICLLR